MNELHENIEEVNRMFDEATVEIDKNYDDKIAEIHKEYLREQRAINRKFNLLILGCWLFFIGLAVIIDWLLFGLLLYPS